MTFMDQFSSIFGAKPGAGVPTYEQLQMRRKIAETLLGQKNKYPKTLGEGLGAIGEAIGERGLLNQADAAAQAREAQVGPEYDRAMGTTPAATPLTARPTSYAPDDTIIDTATPPIPRIVPPSAPGNLPPTGEPGNDGSTHFAPPLQTTPAQRDAMPPDQQPPGAAPVRMMTPDQLRSWRLQNPLPPGVAPPGGALPGTGPQSGIVDPGLNQSVALNQTAPPAPSGPPMAFSGQTASDAPPVGMPRDAIAGTLNPKPPPVVAPPVPPPPPPTQIAQAPPQQQIQVPQRELKAPEAIQMTPEMKNIAVLSGKLSPDDPRQKGLQLRYQQLQAGELEKYNQKLEEYKYQRGQKDTAPERAAKLQSEQQQADVAKRYGGPIAYQKFIEDSSKSYEATQQLANGLPTLKQAKQALAQSYTGQGADLKLDAGKMLRAIGVPGDYTQEVATEMLQSRMKAIAGGMIKSTVGAQNISDADREFVEKAYSGNIKMEPESLRRLLSIAEDTTIRSVNRHNDRLLSVANDPAKDAAIRNQYTVPMQYGDDAVAYLKAHPDTAAMFDKKFGKGHAKAVLSGGRYGE